MQETYKLLNEGLGGCYERIAYSNVIMRIARERGCKNFLELGASYIAGIPGFNSCLLAQHGYNVALTVNSRDYEDTCRAWKMLGLDDRAWIIKWDSVEKTNFAHDQFDFVWNHLAFEHQPIGGRDLIYEMRRVSNDVVMNLTLAPYNLGYIGHWLMHKYRREPWDHGPWNQMTIGAMKRAHTANNLEVIETGACDVPPWVDTVDGKINESMTYLDSYGMFADKWVWCSADPRCQDHWLVKLMWSWEDAMPKWFKILVGHHLYVASTKRS